MNLYRIHYTTAGGKVSHCIYCTYSPDQARVLHLRDNPVSVINSIEEVAV